MKKVEKKGLRLDFNEHSEYFVKKQDRVIQPSGAKPKTKGEKVTGEDKKLIDRSWPVVFEAVLKAQKKIDDKSISQQTKKEMKANERLQGWVDTIQHKRPLSFSEEFIGQVTSELKEHGELQPHTEVLAYMVKLYATYCTVSKEENQNTVPVDSTIPKTERNNVHLLLSDIAENEIRAERGSDSFFELDKIDIYFTVPTSTKQDYELKSKKQITITAEPFIKAMISSLAEEYLFLCQNGMLMEHYEETDEGTQRSFINMPGFLWQTKPQIKGRPKEAYAQSLEDIKILYVALLSYWGVNYKEKGKTTLYADLLGRLLVIGGVHIDYPSPSTNENTLTSRSTAGYRKDYHTTLFKLSECV